MIFLQCPHCKAPSRVGDADAGKAARCPSCRLLFRVPGTPSKLAPRQVVRIRPNPPDPPALPPSQPEYDDFEIVRDDEPARGAAAPDDVVEDVAVVEEPELLDALPDPEGGRETFGLVEEPAERRPAGVAGEDGFVSADTRDGLPHPCPADEEDVEDVEGALRPRRRRRPPLGNPFTGGEIVPGVGPFVVLLFGVVVFWLLFGGLAMLVPPLAVVLVALGAIFALVGNLWFLYAAFQDDAATGLLCLFVPGYALFFLASNIDSAGRPFLVGLLGLLMLLTGVALMFPGA